MNIAARLKDPAIEGLTVGGSFSLRRRSYDSRLLASCAVLQSAYPDLEVQSDVQGVNRLSIGLLGSGEVKRHRHLIGNVSLRAALVHILETVPTVRQRMCVEIAALAIKKDLSRPQGKYYLEATLAEDSLVQLGAESHGITHALEDFCPVPSDEFNWSWLPDNMSIATLPSNADFDFRAKVLETATAAFPSWPFSVDLTSVQCTIPGQGRS